mgnify:CR=1 FL=1
MTDVVLTPYFLKVDKSKFLYKKIFIINGGQNFAHSGGKFNQTVTDWTLEYLTNSKKFEIKTNDQGLSETRELNLNSKINHLESFCKEEDINYEDFKNLKTYKSVILNSLAHNDIHSPLYKVELEKVLDVLEKLNQYKRIEFIKPNSTFTIDFTKPDGSIYTIGIKTKDNLYLIEKDNDFVRLSNICNKISDRKQSKR